MRRSTIFNEYSKESISFLQYRYLMNKSDFVYSILKILNFIEPNSDFDTSIYDNIIQLVTFFCQDHPDNVIIIFNTELLVAICKFPEDHAEYIFDFFISCLKTLVHYEYELTYMVKWIKMITTYFLNIMVI